MNVHHMNWPAITDHMALQFYIIICILHASSSANQNKFVNVREKYAWRLEVSKSFIANLKTT